MPIDIDQEDQEMKEERTLRDAGGSVVLTIPPDIARQAGFSPGDDIQVVTPFDGGEITLREATDDRDEEPSEASTTK